MKSGEERSRGDSKVAAFAWGTLAVNLGVILWGAYVRASGSGAGCGSHWPLCNGEVVPRAPEVATLIEFGHRISSGLALVAVVLLWIFSFRAYPSRHPVRRGASLSLFFIVVEALLGAGLVLLELVADDDSLMRVYWMIAHLLNTFILVAVLALTAWWASGGSFPRAPFKRGTFPLLALGAAGVLFVGATGAIAALGDTLFPADSLQEGLRDSFSSDSHPLIQLRKYHPLAAIIVGLYLVVVARRLSAGAGALARKLALLLTVIYGTQLIAGTINIILLAPVPMQLGHLLLADLLWIALILLGAELLDGGEPKLIWAGGGQEARGLDMAERSR